MAGPLTLPLSPPRRERARGEGCNVLLLRFSGHSGGEKKGSMREKLREGRYRIPKT
jgi:hypothetical protein